MKRKAKSQATHSGLAVVNPNAAAIDIGATMHVAAVGADRASDPVRSFGTFTADLHRLADWFAECGVKTIVMESTSVYWIPIFELLDERGFEVILVNARDAKHVPGRKTDMSDAKMIHRFFRVSSSALCMAFSIRVDRGAPALHLYPQIPHENVLPPFQLRPGCRIFHLPLYHEVDAVGKGEGKRHTLFHQ